MNGFLVRLCGAIAVGMAISTAAAVAHAQAPASPPSGQGGPPAERTLSPEQLDQMVPKHPGFLGALAPDNLNKPRPAPPFNLTGTSFIDLSGGSASSCSARPIRSSMRLVRRP